MAKFKYKKRSAESVEKRAQGSSDRDHFLKDEFAKYSPADGDNLIRILPPTWDDAQHHGLDIHVHYGIGPDKGAFLSLNKHKGEADPIYEERLQAQNDGDDEYAKELRPNTRTLVWVIDRDKEEDGPKLWAMPFGVDKEISIRCKDKKSGEVLYIDDPDDGYDVEFTKTGSGKKTKYEGIQISRRSSPISDDEDQAEEWLEFIEDNPLPSVLEFKEYDYIKRVFGSGGSSSGSKSSSSKKESKSEMPSVDDMLEMSLNDLDDVCEANNITLFASDFDSPEDFVKAICKEEGIDFDAGEEEEEEETRDRKRNLRKKRRDS